MMDRYAQLCDVAGNVSRETFASIESFESEFRRWSARINLAAPSTLPQLWSRHILDSAQLMPLAPDAKIWLDIGSGGGFPGAIVAILLKDRPGATMSLVESNRKKAAFLQTVLATARAPATVFPVRIEDSVDKVQMPDVVTARALASLELLLTLTEPWLAAGARALFHKGRDYAAEVEKCHDGWQFDLVEHRSVIDDDSVILDISGLKRR
jgi:16S rRNA (guanine527-N7)-methyltransferase